MSGAVARRAAPTTRAAVSATLLSAIIWGTSFPVNDIGLAHVTPTTFVFLRFAVAGAIALVVVAALGQLDASFARTKAFWVLVALNAAGFLMQYVGQTLTTPARTALLVNVSAFGVAILERFLLGMRVGAPRLLAILVGVLGAGLLIVGGDLSTLTDVRILGDLLALGTGLAWSLYTVLNREALATQRTGNLLAWTFAGTAIALAPTLLFDAAPLAVPAAGVGPVLWAALGTTAIAYALWAYGLRAIRATTSAVLLLVEILVASVISFAIGRETFGLWEYGGAALLVAAVVAMTLLAPADEPVREQPA